jgi:hypothetical protein
MPYYGLRSMAFSTPIFDFVSFGWHVVRKDASL